MTGEGPTRRQFIIVTLLGGGSIVASQAVARAISGGVPWLPSEAPRPQAYAHRRFLTAAERRCVDALVSRIIPADEIGPGAREAGVVDFIDSQLAGFWGGGERWYMKGPFQDGTDEQGYQSEHPPADLYRVAIAALDALCLERFGGKVFAELAAEEQDALLKGIEEGEVELTGVSALAFFGLLRENTIEGFFCDPIYGGNRDMVGWRLVGFPGARYDYRPYLDHNGSAIALKPVGLRGRPGWNVD